ncbi:MAG: GSCFA domain-containing protein [Nanoarchaeota archaeon]|nr:GSCFA domain-containing protein [Nanoarchaeota archaeon]
MITEILFPEIDRLGISSLERTESFKFPSYTDKLRDYGFYEVPK